jgi:hypothetical protein
MPRKSPRKSRKSPRKSRKKAQKPVVKKQSAAIQAEVVLDRNQDYLQWLIDRNHPQRRQNYINGYLSDPQVYLANKEREDAEIQNGDVVGLFFNAALTALSGGSWALIGLGFLAGGLQLLLRPGEQKQQSQDKRFNPTYAGNYGSTIMRVGETYPAIFCSKSEDPTGGIYTTGKLVNVHIDTVDGRQTIYARSIISHGIIGSIDLDRTIINEQPREHYSAQDLQLSWQNGTQTTAPLGFTDYSQNYTVQSNNQVGVGLILETTPLLNPDGSSYIRASNEKADQLSGQGKYLIRANATADATTFYVASRVLDPVSGQTTVTPSAFLPAVASSVHSYFDCYYRTTKRVNRIDLNFSTEIWARNKNSELIDFIGCYTVYIKPYRQANYQVACHLLIRTTKTTAIKLKGLTFKGLALDTYDISIRPKVYSQDNIVNSAEPTFMLDDTSAIQTEPITLATNSGSFFCEYQGYKELTPANWVFLCNLNTVDAPSNSFQGKPSLTLLNVNERELVSATTRARDLSLNGFATSEAIVRPNSQLNGSINFQFFVTEGIQCIHPIFYGVALAGSDLLLIHSGDPSIPATLGNSIRNLDRRQSGIITGAAATLIAAAGVTWEEGDRFIIYNFKSSCYVPEIRNHLSFDPRFGLSEDFIFDYDIDLQSCINTTKWLAGANEHGTKFAWHGVLSKTEEIGAINDRLSRETMIFPCDRNGQAGYLEQKTPDSTVGKIYNATNTRGFKLELSAFDATAPNTVKVKYRELEQTYLAEPNLQYIEMSVTARTWAVAQGLDREKVLEIDLSNCTSRSQAIKHAQIALNLARYSNHSNCSFAATTIDSLYLPPGDLIRAQTVEVTYTGQQSGIVVEVVAGRFRLDSDPVVVEGISVSSAFGVSDRVVDYTIAGIQSGDLVVNLETNLVSPVTNVTATDLTCAPPIPLDVQYQVLDLTHAGNVACISTDDPNTVYPFTAQFLGGHVWYTIAGIIPEVLDVVLIGGTLLEDRLFQCLGVTQNITPSTNGEGVFESQIVATNWNKNFYNYGDIEIITRDAKINPAP